MIRTLAALALLAGGAATAEPALRYSGETTRYGHLVLGKSFNWTTLHVGQEELTLSPPLVFEDTAPRLFDMSWDGAPDASTVVAHDRRGAALRVYDLSGELGPHATTPFIGRSHRWLAPVGGADFDGDGRPDYAYVETPHIGGILRIWTLRDGTLVQIASRFGLSNHRIGEDFISGGVRDCGAGPEIVTADARWREILVSRLEDGEIRFDPLGLPADPEGFARAMACTAAG